MSELRGAIKEATNCLRIIPHGRLYDQYERNEYVCPFELSFAAAVLKPNGGMSVEIRDSMSRFDQFTECGWRVWICRRNWRDLNSSPLIVRDPLPWDDVSWLVRECHLTVLTWLRAQNDPDAWNIPGLRVWLNWFHTEGIRKVGFEEYCKQHRAFWHRDYVGVV